MGESPAALRLGRFGETERRDAWWIDVALTCAGLGAFAVYATLRAFEGRYYAWGPYLSPFYSPLIDENHRWLPIWFSPALLILAAPLGFRVTCYYYRKAYYRSFFLDPPACAVSEGGGRKYSGETKFPFILQNLHRYFFYLAILFLFFLWWDAIVAFDFDGHFGAGLGSIIMLVNVILLTIYALSCHSLRHLIGGKLDCFSCVVAGQRRYEGWRAVTRLNEHHMLFAWMSLFSVGLTDLYIRLVSANVITDLRLW